MRQPSRPRLGLSPVLFPRCAFDEAFRITAEAGFEGIGLRYDRLQDFLARGGTISDVKSLLAGAGLRFAEAAFLAEWQFYGGLPLVSRRQRTGDADENDERLLANLHHFFRHCEELECQDVTAVPALRETGDLDVAAEQFGKLCDLARPYGIRLCLEFMGVAPQIRDLATADRVIGSAGRANGGVLIDTFLFYQGGSRLEDIDAVPIERVFNVQLADAKPLPREALNMLEDRLYPGEGVAGVREIVSRLSARGYKGWWTVELFNPEYAAADPAAVARAAYASASELLTQVLSEPHPSTV